MNVGLFVAVVACVGTEVTAHGAPWHYSAAAHWAGHFPTCAGQEQSPVNINRAQARTYGFLPIQFHDYDVLPNQQTVTNNGHSLQVEFTSTSKAPYITWGGYLLTKKVQYHFVQYHFHWGSVTTQGSEHTMDTVRFPMELHLVHFNHKYESLNMAVTKPDGLAVLGILFVISPNDNPALAPLLVAAREIKDYNGDHHFVSKTNLFALASLLPSNTSRFYRYKGSLTTPTCNEAVLWTIFDEPIMVSEAQMDVFRSLVGFAGSTSDNFRPVQDLNGREIGKSF